MKWTPAPPLSQQISNRIESLVHAGTPQQEVIREMRAAGLNIIDCMKLTSLFYGLEWNETKWLVHFSDAWADMRGQHDAFHEIAFEAAKQAGFEEVEEIVSLRSVSLRSAS